MLSSVETFTNYKLSFELNIPVGSAQMKFDNSNGAQQYIAVDTYSTGNQIIYFTTDGTINIGGLGIQASSGDFDFDNVTLQEVLANGSTVTGTLTSTGILSGNTELGAQLIPQTQWYSLDWWNYEDANWSQ